MEATVRKDEPDDPRSRLITFRENIPPEPANEVHEGVIAAYHSLVTELESAYGRSLAQYRIPAEDIRPKVIEVEPVRPVDFSARAGTLRTPRKSGYSQERYCLRTTFLLRIDGLITSLAETTIALARRASHSCFISYSTNDQEFADRLYADLQNKGVRCWFAPHDIRGGKKIHEQIDQAIRIYDRLLLILSEHSMRSEWVKTEIAPARQKELREQRQVLFPIALVPFARIREWKCFDADTGKDSAREIREYFVPDFSIWKDSASYRKAFGQLVRDLESERGAPSSRNV